MIHDGRLDLDFSYNYLNLLNKITDSDDQMVADYTYLADGTKVSVTDAAGNGYAYLGSMAFAEQGNTLSLESVGFGGGRINKATNGYDIAYHITDHLGSTRAIVQNGEVVEQNDYYPFGEKRPKANLATTTNRYRYNGKELQTTGNLDLLDYGARMYDSNIGRWFVQDPLAENAPSLTPYHFTSNNPINRIDPNGMWDDWYFNEFGEFLGQDEAETDFIRIIQDDYWKMLKNEDNTIDNRVGVAASELFSQSDLSDENALKVYSSINSLFKVTDVPLVINTTLDAGILMQFNGSSDGSTSININHSAKGMMFQSQYNASNSAISDNIYNVLSVLDHENKHASDFKNMGYEIYKTTPSKIHEYNAYNHQIQDNEFWKRTDNWFRQLIVNSFNGYK